MQSDRAREGERNETEEEVLGSAKWVEAMRAALRQFSNSPYSQTMLLQRNSNLHNLEGLRRKKEDNPRGRAEDGPTPHILHEVSLKFSTRMAEVRTIYRSGPIHE